MRISIIFVLALALFAQAAYAETKPAPKLTKITGYGEYKLGTPISQYDLSKFKGPSKAFLYNEEYFPCFQYQKEDTFKIGDNPRVKVYLTLSTLHSRLHSITIEVIDKPSQFTNYEALTSFARTLHRALLDKYSSDLVLGDTFSDWDYSQANAGPWKEIILLDKDGNSLKMLLMVAVELIYLDYETESYKKAWDKACERSIKENFEGDSGKL